MKRANRLSIALLIAAAATAGAAAAAKDRWVHVRVEERGPGGERIRVNLPMQMLESMLPLIRLDELDHGRLRISEADLEGLDLRQMLEALHEAPDGKFVTLRSEDESVRVAKERGLLKVQVDDSDSERVRVAVPLAVVEALLGGGGRELDLLAGLRRLAEYDGGDLVTVESEDETVRIWIDDSEAGD